MVARASIVSLLIALTALLLANIQSPSMITAGLKIIFMASSSVGVSALVMWVIFSGVQFVFGKREEPPENTPLDLL
jgi:hypothetical protein